MLHHVIVPHHRLHPLLRAPLRLIADHRLLHARLPLLLRSVLCLLQRSCQLPRAALQLPVCNTLLLQLSFHTVEGGGRLGELANGQEERGLSAMVFGPNQIKSTQCKSIHIVATRFGFGRQQTALTKTLAAWPTLAFAKLKLEEVTLAFLFDPFTARS